MARSRAAKTYVWRSPRDVGQLDFGTTTATT
jgi:hypothetical protein